MLLLLLLHPMLFISAASSPVMILVKMLGLFDLLVALAIILGQISLVPTKFLLICAAYLLAKGFLFLSDGASKIDIAVAIYCLILIFQPLIFLTVLSAGYLVVKALFSMAA
jgi:hypothetical protein